MNAADLSERVINRLFAQAESIEARLLTFLSDPANLDTPHGRRILELLALARERMEADASG